MDKPIICAEHLSMCYRMDANHISSFKELFVAVVKRQRRIEEFAALTDVSFSVGRGEVVGLIGRNGAGKSTLLKVIAGLLKPTKGSVTLDGNVVPMLELGSGFDMELTGRENIFLNGAILGYGRRFLEERYEEIVDFSEIRDFIDMPLKTYSSGMLTRLAFSISTVVKPDILIVDEILAVGDENFQRKSRSRMLQLMDGGTTVLIVSHNLEQIRDLCDRVLWLDHGQLLRFGDTETVCDAYAASFP